MPAPPDTVRYDYSQSTGAGVAQTPLPFVVSSLGTDTIPNLLAGYYSNIIVQEGLCYTPAIGPLQLVNPPFTFRTVTGSSPTKCGYCDGKDTLFGLHPGQHDTLTYTLTQTSGVTTISTAVTISADSFVIFSGLCNGTYDNFIVNTAGVCTDTSLFQTILQGPNDTAQFNYTIHYGCISDTVVLNNLSASVPGDVLYYHWDFGDGATDNSFQPHTHLQQYQQ